MRYNLSNNLSLMQFELRCASLKKKGAIVELTEKKTSRSISQNALFHVWVKVFSECVGETNLDKLKSDIKRCLLGRKVEINSITGEEEVGDYHTSTMSSADMSAFLDKFKAFAANEYNCYLPYVGDVGYEEMLGTYL